MAHSQLNPYSHILVNSFDRDDFWNSNPANFRLNLPKPIKPSCAKLSYCQIPNTFYNVTTNNNSISAGFPDSGRTTYFVTPGAYSLNDLTQALQTLLAPLGTVTVTYNNISGFVTIANSAAFDLEFGDNSLAKILGFNPDLDYIGQTSYTATLTPKVYSSAIYIQFNIGNAIQTSVKQRSDYSFVIPNTCNKGEIIQFYASTQFDLRPRVKDNFIGYIEFRVFDEYGFELQGLADWSIMIQVV